jgi:hypothetical protein
VEVTRQIVARLNPEAAYFVAEDGKRSCLVVFDMADTSQIPVIAEPLFQGAKAMVTFAPCMNLDDVEKGLAQAYPQGGESTL